MSQPVLRTERLTLRPFATGDAVALHRFLRDPAATRYWSDPHRSFAESQAFVDGTIAGASAEVCDFVIEREGQVIGKAGMWGRPEVGFFVLPEFQRMGYAREALTAIVPHLFQAYELDRLIADVDPENAASIALLKGLGFTIKGQRAQTIRIGGRWCDSLDMVLTRTEWDARA